jgi:hypothetical protein
MKLGGKKLSANVVVIPIPRGDGEDIFFRAQAVLSMEEFDKICPVPKAPKKLVKGQGLSENRNDPIFLAAMKDYAKNRLSWMVIESLKATPDLEWETVKADEPSTWNGYEKELREAGFSEMELVRVVQGVMDANCLNEDLINEARKRFLSLAQQGGECQSLTDEAPSSPSTEPANASG